MLLRADFPNGVFGDPALYVWEINGNDALLFDCGDLSRLMPKQLLKVSHIFLSHCHMDHIYGFDALLRVHVGSEKSVTIVGPPDTSKRIFGKLQGYTWNLVSDQTFGFTVIDLHVDRGEKLITRFLARDAFHPSDVRTERWNPRLPVVDQGIYCVSAEMLDHRTPSMAYVVEEKLTMGVNADALKNLALRPGPWINELKRLFLDTRLEGTPIEVTHESGERRHWLAHELANKILIRRQRHKIAYATDGAADEHNRERLLRLIGNADVFFSETCFMVADTPQATATKHFTTRFVAELAREANAAKLIPFHFSKRYLECPEAVWNELDTYYGAPVVRLTKWGAASRQAA